MFTTTAEFLTPPPHHFIACRIAFTILSTPLFLPVCGLYLHGCPIFDVILLSQLLAGEVHVLLPQALALPTCFLKKTANVEEREDPAHH